MKRRRSQLNDKKDFRFQPEVGTTGCRSQGTCGDLSPRSKPSRRGQVFLQGHPRLKNCRWTTHFPKCRMPCFKFSPRPALPGPVTRERSKSLLIIHFERERRGGGGTIDQESNLNSNNWKTDGRSCLVLSCSPPSSTKDLRAVNKGEKIPGTFEIGGNRLGTRFCTNYMMDGAMGHVSFLHFLTGGRGDDHNVLEMRIPVASDWKQFPTRQLQQSDE